VNVRVVQIKAGSGIIDLAAGTYVSQDRSLGLAFIATAAEALGKGGRLWLVANRGLPYEAALAKAFARVEKHAEAGGYKVYEARK